MRPLDFMYIEVVNLYWIYMLEIIVEYLRRGNGPTIGYQYYLVLH